MTQYIDKDAVVAEIERISCENPMDNSWYVDTEELLDFLDTLEVKEIDLEKKIKSWLNNGNITDTRYDDYDDGDIESTAKHFFELGLKASNPITTITKENLESLVRQVIDLYLEAGEHYNSVIKEEREENGGSYLVIKLLDGVIDAKELSIQYVLDKLKAQKGEEA